MPPPPFADTRSGDPRGYLRLRRRADRHAVGRLCRARGGHGLPRHALLETLYRTPTWSEIERARVTSSHGAPRRTGFSRSRPAGLSPGSTTPGSRAETSFGRTSPWRDDSVRRTAPRSSRMPTTACARACASSGSTTSSTRSSRPPKKAWPSRSPRSTGGRPDGSAFRSRRASSWTTTKPTSTQPRRWGCGGSSTVWTAARISRPSWRVSASSVRLPQRRGLRRSGNRDQLAPPLRQGGMRPAIRRPSRLLSYPRRPGRDAPGNPPAHCSS